MLDVRQLLLLNVLMYAGAFPFPASDAPAHAGGWRVAELIRGLDPSALASGHTPAAKWATMLDHIRADARLLALRAEHPYRDDATGDTGCLFSDPATGEAILVFRGTGSGEWRDNFTAGGESGPDALSPQQRRALAFARSLNLSDRPLVTATGHSKGGNKAKLCALLLSEIDRCVAFDGQGFSDAFMRRYAREIAANRRKIGNHNADRDLVNALLNDVGDTYFYESHPAGGFFSNHAPSALLDEDCRMTLSVRAPEIAALDRFLNAYLRSMTAERRTSALALCGEIAQCAANGEGEAALAALCAPRWEDDAAYLLAYALKYERETGEISASILGILDEMGLSALARLLRLLKEWLRDGFALGLARKALRLGLAAPPWLLAVVEDRLGATMEAKQTVQLLRIAALAAEDVDGIEILPGTGEDIAWA